MICSTPFAVNQQRKDTFISVKSEQLCLHFNKHSITFLGIHLHHLTYKREKYSFINANIRVIIIILKIIGDNRQTFKCIFYNTVCNSVAFLDSFRMDKTSINVLVQSIEHSLHLIIIQKSIFNQTTEIQTIWSEFQSVKCISLKNLYI